MKKNIIKNKYLSAAVVIMASMGFFGTAVASSEAQEVAPVVETKIVSPDGTLQNTSLELNSEQNQNFVPNVIEFSEEDQASFQEDKKGEKIDLSIEFKPEIFASLSLSIKNFSRQLRKDSKEDNVVLSEIDAALKNSVNAQKNIDEAAAGLENRGAMAALFFGPKYAELNKMQKYVTDNESIAKQAQELSAKVKNQQLAEMVLTFGIQISAKNLESKQKIMQFENKKSVLGWLIKKFY